MTVAKVGRQIAAIQKSAEKMHAKETALIGTASVGDVVRQGDLYLVCIDSLLPGTKTGKQLAPGETQGSRHIAEGRCSVYLPKERGAVSRLIATLSRGAVQVPDALIGPLVECHGETTITHPEHGHRVLPAGSTWAVVYQRAYAEEVRRVQD